jgi:hypothetical protein
MGAVDQSPEDGTVADELAGDGAAEIAAAATLADAAGSVFKAPERIGTSSSEVAFFPQPQSANAADRTHAANLEFVSFIVDLSRKHFSGQAQTVSSGLRPGRGRYPGSNERCRHLLRRRCSWIDNTCPMVDNYNAISFEWVGRGELGIDSMDTPDSRRRGQWCGDCSSG